MTVILALVVAWVAYGYGFSHYAVMTSSRPVNVWMFVGGVMCGFLNPHIRVKRCPGCLQLWEIKLFNVVLYHWEGHHE